MQKYSKQRETILRVVKNVSCHPTAASVYDRVRGELPHISLGTVYRNLSMLKKTGKIISFTPLDGVERFDGNTGAHLHLVCTSCGEVIDIPALDMEPVLRQVSSFSGQEITGYTLLFYGLCDTCKASINNITALPKETGGNVV